jgi:hypothetical protein
MSVNDASGSVNDASGSVNDASGSVFDDSGDCGITFKIIMTIVICL